MDTNIEPISTADVEHAPISENETITGEAYKGDPRASDYEFRNGYYIIKLQNPFMFASKEITELELRKPRARNMKHLSATPSFGELMKIVYDVSNERRIVMDMVDMSDMAEAIEFVGKFF